MIYKGFRVDKDGNVLEYFDNTPKWYVKIKISDFGKPIGENLVKLKNL